LFASPLAEGERIEVRGSPRRHDRRKPWPYPLPWEGRGERQRWPFWTAEKMDKSAESSFASRGTKTNAGVSSFLRHSSSVIAMRSTGRF